MMASNVLGRPGVMLPPSLPTIKETTLSWIGSDLESSLFSTNGKGEDDTKDRRNVAVANVQRYIDFDDQCLSLKSGEESDFSGIQPLPIGSDDTPPMAVNNFNRVVRMDFGSLLESQDRPKPNIHSDDESVDEYLPLPNEESHRHPDQFDEEPAQVEANRTKQGITAADFEKLIGMLDGADGDGDLSNVANSGDGTVLERLQLIRLWQLMQEEELKRRQETELAMLHAQKLRMQGRLNDDQNLGLERVTSTESESDGIRDDEDDMDGIESGDLLSNVDDHLEDPASDQNDAEVESLALAAYRDKTEHFDEVPIEHAKKKSFEQLLEEELQKEQKVQNPKEPKPKGPIKRPFLRKGQGLARFKGPPVRKQPPVKPKADNVTNDKPTKREANKGTSVKTKDTITKQPVNSSKTNKPQQPVTNHKPAYKKTKPSIQKLTLKPGASTSNRSVTTVVQTDKGCSEPKEEDMDLEEFEMLEKYAEDDASFFSEPSLVVSLLQHERGDNGAAKDEANMSLRERVRERRRLREEARKQVHSSINIRNGRGNVDFQRETHMQMRTTPEGPSPNECATGDDDLESTIRNDSTKNGFALDSERSLGPPSPYFIRSPPESQKVKVIQRKTASLVKREKLVRPVAQPANGLTFSPLRNPLTQMSANQAFAKLQSSPNSAFSPHQHPIVTTGSCRSSSDNDDKEENAGYEMNEFEDEKTWGDIELSVLNTSQQGSDMDDDMEDAKEPGSERTYKSSDYMEPESEEVENPVKDTDKESKLGGSLSLSPPPPPTLLMQKLFPGLKIPKNSTVQKIQQNAPPAPDEDINPTSPHESEDVSQASLLKQKLEELEKEISKFKKENSTLETMRGKQEEQLQHLSKEMEEFKKQKEEELARLEEYKKTETKKLKKERRLFEEHVIATKMMPRKEEREEIQKLQEEVESLKQENKAKEQRWISANNRMRGQVERLEKENKELLDRVNEMEAQRVKEWGKKKQNTTKGPSMWQAVNEIVESSVFDTENENPDRTHLSTSDNSARSATSVHKNKKSAKVPKKDVEKPMSKSCMKKPTKLPVLNSHDDNIMSSESGASDSQSETTHKDGKIERMLKDGSRLVEFPNGTLKEISADGNTVKVKFPNGDIKQIYPDGSVVYYYEENGTTHTTHPDGLQVLEFPNKQIEHVFPDGTKQITFPDQTIKYLHTDSTEQTIFPDGTEMHVAANKDKTIVFSNGQREIHTDSFKRREYPNGTSKTVFNDGRQETRFASGRIRVKDPHGNVIVDRMANSAT